MCHVYLSVVPCLLKQINQHFRDLENCILFQTGKSLFQYKITILQQCNTNKKVQSTAKKNSPKNIVGQTFTIN